DHLGVTTFYHGLGQDVGQSDEIDISLTTSQLYEILTNPGLEATLSNYLAGPAGQTLDLSGSTWNAKADGFEGAAVYMANEASGNVSQLWIGALPSLVAGQTGDAGGNLIIGSAAGQTLDGGGGDDILVAAAGGNTLDGGAGYNVLIGGSGVDTL